MSDFLIEKVGYFFSKDTIFLGLPKWQEKIGTIWILYNSAYPDMVAEWLSASAPNSSGSPPGGPGFESPQPLFEKRQGVWLVWYKVITSLVDLKRMIE